MRMYTIEINGAALRVLIKALKYALRYATENVFKGSEFKMLGDAIEMFETVEAGEQKEMEL